MLLGEREGSEWSITHLTLTIFQELCSSIELNIRYFFITIYKQKQSMSH